MTEKEVAIKLFKTKIKTNDLNSSMAHGVILKGCYFGEDNIEHFVGIGRTFDSYVIHFNSFRISLEENEYNDLEKCHEDTRMEIYNKKQQEKEKKLIKDWDSLAEIASKENFDISRRILTEKYKNFKF